MPSARENAERGVSFVGRLATYRYYNMDQVVGMALAEFEGVAATFTANPLVPYFGAHLLEAGLEPAIEIGPYHQLFQVCLDHRSSSSTASRTCWSCSGGSRI